MSNDKENTEKLLNRLVEEMTNPRNLRARDQRARDLGVITELLGSADEMGLDLAQPCSHDSRSTMREVLDRRLDRLCTEVEDDIAKRERNPRWA
jgi:hypothetical protein